MKAMKSLPAPCHGSARAQAAEVGVLEVAELPVQRGSGVAVLLRPAGHAGLEMGAPGGGSLHVAAVQVVSHGGRTGGWA